MSTYRVTASTGCSLVGGAAAGLLVSLFFGDWRLTLAWAFLLVLALVIGSWLDGRQGDD